MNPRVDQIVTKTKSKTQILTWAYESPIPRSPKTLENPQLCADEIQQRLRVSKPQKKAKENPEKRNEAKKKKKTITRKEASGNLLYG